MNLVEVKKTDTCEDIINSLKKYLLDEFIRMVDNNAPVSEIQQTITKIDKIIDEFQKNTSYLRRRKSHLRCYYCKKWIDNSVDFYVCCYGALAIFFDPGYV